MDRGLRRPIGAGGGRSHRVAWLNARRNRGRLCTTTVGRRGISVCIRVRDSAGERLVASPGRTDCDSLAGGVRLPFGPCWADAPPPPDHPPPLLHPPRPHLFFP